AVGSRITVRVDPAAVGPNLDATVSLFDSAGNLIASADPNALDRGQLSAELTATVASGTYYVVVGSHGAYGDVGQYTVTVTEPPPTTARPPPVTVPAAPPVTVPAPPVTVAVPPRVRFTTADQKVSEGGTVNVVVELLSGSSGTVMVPYTVTVPDALSL